MSTIDLRGKLALVTGGSGGLGAETARALASKGARVVITARDVPKGDAVARGIRASTTNDAVEVEELEPGSLTGIRPSPSASWRTMRRCRFW
jgi:NAD(P)-dependent dehydrogenase (short-subunit alcohol dehydrogenase family)